jgi:hypothetical protein
MADKNRGTGAWLIITDHTIVIESSELKALRTALEMGGKHLFAKYGEKVAARQSQTTDPTDSF